MENRDPTVKDHDGPRVAVCVITYHRPCGLKRLLDGLNQLAFTRHDPSVEIFIVDNDPDGSSREIFERAQSEVTWPLHYAIETNRGIPYARNKAMACAKGQSDFLAFIDDDEVPEPAWLDELLCVQSEYKADVVTGPVAPVFASEAPLWIVRGRFFDPELFPTGHNLSHAYTNNVLIRTAILETLRHGFDERLALAGSTDSLFFRRVFKAGYSIVWSDRAMVKEWIPATRTTTRWLLRRAYRVGNASYGYERCAAPVIVAAAKVLAESLYRLLRGTALMVLSLFRGRAAFIRSLREICRSVGILIGLVGFHYQEYKNTHGE